MMFYSMSWDGGSYVGAIDAPYGQIPQHRVKASKRALQYSANHPWISQGRASRDESKGRNTRDYETISRNSTRKVQEIHENTDKINSNSSGNVVTEEILPATNDTIWWIDSGEILGDEKDTYQPIRIRAGLISHPSSGFSILSMQQRELLLEVIRPSLQSWSRALSVARVQGNLTIDKDQLYDGISCGPGLYSGQPSVVVPSEHMKIGIPDTDLMVYVSLGFQSPSIAENAANPNSRLKQFKPSRHIPGITSGPTSSEILALGQNLTEHDWGQNFTNYDHSHFFEGQNKSGFTNQSAISSMQTTKVLTSGPLMAPSVSAAPSVSVSPSIVPTSVPSTAPSESVAPSMVSTNRAENCLGTYLASATYCSTDQFDRPVAGLLHLCIDSDFFAEKNLKMNQVTVMHELGHILGFNSNSMAYFRNRETGEPLTERVQGDVPDVEVNCTGVKDGLSTAIIPLPSEKILQFQEVRGVRVAQIVTPTVQQITRNHFGCQELNGAELESETFHPINGTSHCIGDHWERRLFKLDIMNPIMDNIPSYTFVSPLTLAYFLDSGWYKINADRAFASDTWGRGAGCKFVTDPCIKSDGSVSKANLKFFCNSASLNSYGCTDDMQSKATCSVTEYDSLLPPEYQYFSQGDIGGFDAYLDYCPTFVEAENSVCTDNSNKKNAAMNSQMDQVGFANSRCLSGKKLGEGTSFCLRTACVLEDHSLRLNVDGFWHKCQYTGQVIKSWWNEDIYALCPDPITTCPTFYCPKDCLNHDYAAICNFATGSCDCSFVSENGALVKVDNFGKCYDEKLFGVENEISLSYYAEHSSMMEHYIPNSSELIDDEKHFLDHAARMFITMSVGEFVSFVAYSLLVVTTCVVLIIYTVKFLRQADSPSAIFSCNWLKRSNAWRTDTQWSSSQNNETGNMGNANKDKMVASVLHNMRVETAFIEDGQSLVASINQNDQIYETERTILRSQLPPLPGVGRVVSIPGFAFFDDSIHIGNHDDDNLTIIDGTAAGTRTSCQSEQLELCSVVDNCNDSEIGDISNLMTMEPDSLPIIHRPRRRIIATVTEE